jgi:cell division transport system ATP-binding protein
MEKLVVAENLEVAQLHRKVLSDVNFSIEKGEFVFLIGKNGSGKSSLMKTLYADLPVTHGKVIVADIAIQGIKRSKVPFLRRKLGIVFQDFQLFQDRTVSENLSFVLKATGWKENSKIKNRIAETLMRVGLGSVDSKLPYQLSGGEQQRVVIARALLNDPLLLIADEPTGNLDPEVALGIFKLFREINKGGTAVLMATHNYRFIHDYPARVLKCEEGNLLDSLTQASIVPTL